MLFRAESAMSVLIANHAFDRQEEVDQEHYDLTACRDTFVKSRLAILLGGADKYQIDGFANHINSV